MTTASSVGESARTSKVFVLLHGSFHGAWAFERLASLLVRDGHRVVAPDLPGHGLRAELPRAFCGDRVDPAAMATEVSPVAELGLADWVDPIVDLLWGIRERTPEHDLVLLGHSAAGLVLSAVGEAVPSAIDRLVYLSAFMPPNGWTATDCLAMEELSTSLLTELLVADPAAVGAFRINPRSSDAAYRALVKTVFADDIDDRTWEAVAHLLTPDTSVRLHADPVTTTADWWGSIPRTCINATADRSFPLAAQRHYIRVADEVTPTNVTDVRELAASHSAYWSQPERLADILVGL